MLTRVPNYYDQFHCLAGDCPHTCCAKWEVVIDEETACRYSRVPGSLGEKVRAVLQVDEDGDFCFPLDGGRCPFLNEKNLCDIHLQLGEEATSVTCREHPRFVEDYGPFREITLSASCPEANRLLLESQGPLTFLERETEEPMEEGDSWLEPLLAVRTRLLALLADREKPLRTRLVDALCLACEAQLLLDEEQAEDLPALALAWQPQVVLADGPGLFPAALRFLAGVDVLEPDWRDLLAAAEAGASVEVPEVLLERIAVYFAFRYVLKAVNDGDLLGRVQLCVLAVLTVKKLSAVCGLPEGLRRFSCEVEHSEENLDALLRAFWREELDLNRFLEELSSK